jgi:hypothetical protein
VVVVMGELSDEFKQGASGVEGWVRADFKSHLLLVGK